MQSILLGVWDRQIIKYLKDTAHLGHQLHEDVKCNRWDQLYALEGCISQQLPFDEQKARYNTLQLILQDDGCSLITPVSGQHLPACGYHLIPGRQREAAGDASSQGYERLSFQFQQGFYVTGVGCLLLFSLLFQEHFCG